jgi:ascorbate-specific PTS system EIIC-type component UlaA
MKKWLLVILTFTLITLPVVPTNANTLEQKAAFYLVSGVITVGGVYLVSKTSKGTISKVSSTIMGLLMIAGGLGAIVTGEKILTRVNQ